MGTKSNGNKIKWEQNQMGTKSKRNNFFDFCDFVPI